ncbi:hypothetical protein [Paraburkholderia dioscoreae]|uniref:hypothetical protein n=1 Tax=Paraburkholderia dioscoreae TaxID=2604047 RepID=UPI0013ECE372|nr:hypothetical protein [Paraburkholderia dioscoreae]
MQGKTKTPRTQTQKSPRQPKIPLYESNIHILELSQKPPYNPTQRPKRRTGKATLPPPKRQKAKKAAAKKTGDKA